MSTDRLSLYAGLPIEVRRIALEHGSSRDPQASAKPGQGNDAKTASYKARFNTDECWELDALSPNVIADLIKTEIESLIDQEPWKVAKAKEAKSRRQLAAAADGMA